jgi:type II secretory pathway pseudopilin PulG
MRRVSPSRKARKISGARRSEQGYILLTLMLVSCLLIIAAAAIVPSIAFEMRRAREQEMIHRAVQYRRAIRLYAKRTGRFPAQLEELVGSSDIRYIRKLYKDPMTGKDFRLLHYADVQPFTTPPVNPSSPSPDGQSSDSQSSDPQTANSPSPASQTSFSQASAANSQDSSSSFAQSSLQQGASRSLNGTFSTNSFSANSFNSDSSNSGTSGQQPGQLIFGVASTSKAKSIREFDHKSHYNDWLFFYDPRNNIPFEIIAPNSLIPPTIQLQSQPGQPVSAMQNGQQNSSPQSGTTPPQSSQDPN